MTKENREEKEENKRKRRMKRKNPSASLFHFCSSPNSRTYVIFQ
jgi:hypothetical protein